MCAAYRFDFLVKINLTAVLWVAIPAKFIKLKNFFVLLLLIWNDTQKTSVQLILKIARKKVPLTPTPNKLCTSG